MNGVARISRSGGGCGCGGTGGCSGQCNNACPLSGPTVCPPGAIARPRFFAGQLLTQEDLQLIVDYVVGKRRLQNRLLFGEGVVCGMSVTCPPCGGSVVRVAPGYALDCCGNELYVACTQEVDINALVRELRERQRDGWECGDPCRSKGCGSEKTEAGKGEDAVRDAGDAYHYCLYIKYHESSVEPVVPYSTDAACGSRACEPSRICEGYSFELRCVRKPNPADVFERIKACLGDLEAAAAAAQKAQVNSARAIELKRSAALAAEPQIELADADLRAMDAAANRLDAADLDPKVLDERALRSHLADYQLLAVGVARAHRLDPKKQPNKFAKVIESARGALRETGERLSEAAPQLISDPAAREAAGELFALAERHALSPVESAENSAEARLLRAGAPLSTKQLARMRLDAAQLKTFLRERLERSAAATQCDLLDRLNAIRIADNDDLSADGAEAAGRASEELALILLEYLRDCLCSALNPQCSPCDDAAVLLACVDVRDCKVVDICNMSRRFVLSPAAMRYWLPPISGLGTLIEQFCCELEFKLPRRESESEDERRRLSSDKSFFRVSAAPFTVPPLDPSAKLALDTVGLKVADVERAALLAGHIGKIGLRQAPAIDDAARAVGGGVVAAVGPLRLQGDAALLRRDIERGVDAKIEAEREATLASARDDVGRAVKEEVKTALSEATLDKRLGASKAIKDLLADNKALRAEIKTLSDALKKLQE